MGAPRASKDPGEDDLLRTSSGQGELSRDDLERVRARDPEALSAFFERYFDRIFGLVYRLVGDRTVAEDVTQDVFFKVHKAAHHLDPSRDPGPWLTAIAYNTCRDMWRSGAYRMGRRSGSIEADPTVSLKLTSGESPEAGMVADERRKMVMEAIEQLPEPLRVAVVLHEYQGMSHQEIAAMIGVSHAASRKRYSRALAKMGEFLRERLES